MKILVTGSEGTLGPWLVRELEKNGHDVWGCDLWHGSGKLIRADVAEQRQLGRVFADVLPDVVYHLAAEFGRINGQQYYEQLWRTNCIGTRNVIDCCLRYGSHMVMASSSEAYGTLADEYMLLEEGLLVGGGPEFHNEYALTKYTNEKQIRLAQRNNGLRATVLRFFNVYGPGEEYSAYRSVVCQFIYRILKEKPITVYKGSRRDFLYVGDWARTVARIVEDPNKVLSHSINIGGSEIVSIEDLAQLIEQKIGKKAKVRFQPKETVNVADKRPCMDKARLLLDHQCEISLTEGLDLTIAWMKERYAENINRNDRVPAGTSSGQYTR